MSFPPNLGGCCVDGIGGMSPVNDKGKGSWSDGVGVKVGVGDFEGDDGTVESGGSGRKVIVVDESGVKKSEGDRGSISRSLSGIGSRVSSSRLGRSNSGSSF